MSEYLKMIHEIEEKKTDLEQRISDAVQVEIMAWQKENELPVQNIYIDLANVTTLGEPKTYSVASVSVDIDFKP
ncbi:hypothetical protein EAH57_15615 [Acinetobacter sp. 2JN-4]|uniref:hypothetical protein n=1 Tax=unclassified Acinetobacter TaxID=196816 RepID=UPI000EF9A3C3|nr:MULTISPECIES: hypothetical protein [unclassified Acinetobacter]MCH7307567.1 hypothetical protein [Acinetobacter sp. NIPH 1852]RLZ06567.1 hypothetical protein EAH57_15615 [Acinetobacter sp. 2JN-4]